VPAVSPTSSPQPGAGRAIQADNRAYLAPPSSATKCGCALLRELPTTEDVVALPTLHASWGGPWARARRERRRAPASATCRRGRPAAGRAEGRRSSGGSADFRRWAISNLFRSSAAIAGTWGCSRPTG
jgi:hypothetical protein